MRWQKFCRILLVVSVPVAILTGSIAVVAGVLYGAELLGVPGNRVSPFIALIFFIAVMLLAKVGARVLWASSASAESPPLSFPLTRHQRFWRIGRRTKDWLDSAVLAVASAGCALCAGALAHGLGLGKWTIIALVVPAWFVGVFIAVRVNAWTTRKLARYEPPSEAETLLRTFD